MKVNEINEFQQLALNGKADIFLADHFQMSIDRVRQLRLGLGIKKLTWAEPINEAYRYITNEFVNGSNGRKRYRRKI